MCSGDFHLIEKANGIKYLYASVDNHPDVRSIALAVSAPPHLLRHDGGAQGGDNLGVLWHQ